MRSEITRNKFNDLVDEHEKWLMANTVDEKAKHKRLSLANAKLAEVHVSHRKLIGSDYNNCAFFNCKFDEVDFRSVRIYSSHFQDCVFYNCSFQKSQIYMSNLSGTHLTQSSFYKAELLGNNLMFADFSNSRFDLTITVDCDLRFADFTRAKLTQSTFERVKFYSETTSIAVSVENIVLKDVWIDGFGSGKPTSDIHKVRAANIW